VTAVRILPADLDGRPTPGAPYPIGLAGVVVTVAMLFTAFTAALLVRRTGTDWVRVALPAIVWANTMVILLSSGALERARRLVRAGALANGARWLGAAGILGALFLAGQVVAWRALAGGGVPLGINPHGAFFYMLSAVHGAHVLGGLGALAFTRRRLLAGAYASGHDAGLTHAAIYWHLVGAVWLWLLAMLSTL
jgi:cytochrome c oxidase subunit 3